MTSRQGDSPLTNDVTVNFFPKADDVTTGRLTSDDVLMDTLLLMEADDRSSEML
jgi:hypothetical protein